MEINGQDYQVQLTDERSTVKFSGTLRLREMADYDPIEQLLQNVVATNPAIIRLDLEELEYLNSSGITVLSMFIYNISQSHQETQPVIKISKRYNWQSRLLKNLKQMVPSLHFEQADEL